MWMMIIGILLPIIAIVLGTYFLYTILEALKIVVLVAVSIFGTLWLWAVMKKHMKIDSFLSFCLSFLIMSAVAVWAYNSWWAIIGLGIIVAIAYIVWMGATKLGLSDIVKLWSETKFKGGKK